MAFVLRPGRVDQWIERYKDCPELVVYVADGRIWGVLSPAELERHIAWLNADEARRSPPGSRVSARAGRRR